MAKIYTKTGDDGQSSLYGGGRVSKAHLRMEACGTVDELNCHIGLLASLQINASHLLLLEEIQKDLFTIGAYLATDTERQQKAPLPEFSTSSTLKLEAAIDRWEERLPKMTHFILPGGHPQVAQAHIARTVCRRAERVIVALHEQTPVGSTILTYMNRLSDFLFVLARVMSDEFGAKEIKWLPGK